MLSRHEIESIGWEFIKSLDELMITYGREKQDLFLPLCKGNYRLFYTSGHNRIRIVYQDEYKHCCVFLGKCEDIRTLKLLEELIGIEH